MKLADREQELVARYAIIMDRHERLNAIVSHRAADSEIPNGQRRDEWLVKGCASNVWLHVQNKSRRLHISYGADSQLVRGLVALLVELFQDAELDDARDFSPKILELLELDQMLSSTRLHGLQCVIKKLRHVD